MSSAAVAAGRASGVRGVSQRLTPGGVRQTPPAACGVPLAARLRGAGRAHASARSILAAVAQQGSVDEEDEETTGVYLYNPKPLQEGVEKHTLSVFVADESGLINRVAGVFARRGANIESLAVALNLDKALFTIVMTGTASSVANLCKQVGKLVKVRQVQDITTFKKIDRELLLVRVNALPGAARTEVLQIAEVFRAHVADLGTETIILSAVGDPGKLVALQRLLSTYGIVEIARTGRISLLRGQDKLMGGGWGDSHLYQKRLQGLTGDATALADYDPMVENMPADNDGDVYAVGDSMGDFIGVEPMLNMTIDDTVEDKDQTSMEPDSLKPHMMSIVVNDEPGVLNQVTGVFARRGYNIVSLAVGPAALAGRSRISMVVPGTTASISKLTKQLYKLVEVVKVTDLTGTPHVARELCLIKVSCTPRQRRDLETVANIFHGSIVDVGPTTVVLQLQGKERKLKALQEVLEPYGILEIARTGRVALKRASGVDSTYLQRFQEGRLM